MRMGMSGGTGGAVRRAAAVGVLGALLLGSVSSCAREAAKYPEVRARDGFVTADASGIASESGRFFTYRADGGKRVDFFVYRDSAGAPHAVLDACRTCYRWKKGYLLDGNEVVCVKCDMRFKLDALAQGTGSCVPIQVKSELRGNSLIIPVSELEAGARYF